MAHAYIFKAPSVWPGPKRHFQCQRWGANLPLRIYPITSEDAHHLVMMMMQAFAAKLNIP